ncbi:MAG: NADH-quinone oxidoreductase subunit C [Chloroflexota bacterium]
MSLATVGADLAQALRERFPDAVTGVTGDAVWVRPEAIAQVCAFLRQDPSHDFALLNAVTAVDRVEHFELVYHLTSLSRNATAVLKAAVPGREDPTLPTVSTVWRGALLQEREIWDLMGVRFEGHPDLRRILTWEGFDGHPLRRDYLEPPLPYIWPHGG